LSSHFEVRIDQLLDLRAIYRSLVHINVLQSLVFPQFFVDQSLDARFTLGHSKKSNSFSSTFGWIVLNELAISGHFTLAKSTFPPSSFRKVNDTRGWIMTRLSTLSPDTLKLVVLDALLPDRQVAQKTLNCDSRAAAGSHFCHLNCALVLLDGFLVSVFALVLSGRDANPSRHVRDARQSFALESVEFDAFLEVRQTVALCCHVAQPHGLQICPRNSSPIVHNLNSKSGEIDSNGDGCGLGVQTVQNLKKSFSTSRLW
jgi:hypothetical protein